ncbi:MAG: NAD(+)/NADH kinase [Nitrososphaeraceae archaeon]
MTSNIQNVAIITKNQNVVAAETKEYITKLLMDKNIQVYPIPPFEISDFPTLQYKFGPTLEKTDLIISIGGDGTTLRAFRFYPSSVPVFSINVGGTRGILSEIKIDAIVDSINRIITGKFFYDERIRIQVSYLDKLFPPALNDVLFFRSNLTRTPNITIKYRGDKITQRMDGLLISTPTGSTGHSISLGGPIVHEELDCLTINPIAPINKLPQLIVPLDEILVSSNYKLDLIVDGQDRFSIDPDQTISVKRFPKNARFIRLKKRGLRQIEKLGF